MKSVKYLEELQKKTGLNDTALAKKLNITQPAMSNLKAGRRIMENELCLAVALELGIDPMRVIMAADIDRAERAGQHSLWEVFTARMATAASVLAAVVAVNLFLTPAPSEAAPRLASDGSSTLYYVKSDAEVTPCIECIQHASTPTCNTLKSPEFPAFERLP